MTRKYIIVVLSAVVLCNGHFSSLFPNLSKNKCSSGCSLLGSFTKGLSQASADFFTAAVNGFSKIPTAVTNQMSVFSQIFSNSYYDSCGRCIANKIEDYNIGMKNEDANLNIEQLITKYGYPFEEHSVVTKDGYILKVFRIPGNGEPVLLQHGLLGSSDDFVIAGPENGLAYFLAKQGYDVWMGNARGNKHSRRHLKFDPSEPVFWDFSWHEIGYYDLPATIDYILDTTRKDSLKYIGHSQGCTAFFVMVSERPEYNNKVSLMIALSPVAFMSHCQSPLVKLMTPGTPFYHTIMNTIEMHEFLPDDNLMVTLKSIVCGSGVLSNILCENMIYIMGGVGYEQLNFTNLPVIFGHCPAGSSTKQFSHYGQGVLSGEFRQYDYGIDGNLGRYGAVVPPRYALENIASPISVFFSENDWLAHPLDVDKLINQCNSCTVDIHQIREPNFSNLDFLWGKDSKRLIFERIIEVFERFTPTIGISPPVIDSGVPSSTSTQCSCTCVNNVIDNVVDIVVDNGVDHVVNIVVDNTVDNDVDNPVDNPVDDVEDTEMEQMCKYRYRKK